MNKLNLINYKSYNKKNSRKLRSNMTPGEVKVWQRIRRKQISGCLFTRQKPLLNYIVDFYCKELNLVIEIDGSSHDESKYEYDIKRQKELESLGLKFLRFTEYEAVKKTSDVVQTIINFVESINEKN